jgi:hypothetical protein
MVKNGERWRAGLVPAADISDAFPLADHPDHDVEAPNDADAAEAGFLPYGEEMVIQAATVGIELGAQSEPEAGLRGVLKHLLYDGVDHWKQPRAFSCEQLARGHRSYPDLRTARHKSSAGEPGPISPSLAEPGEVLGVGSQYAKRRRSRYIDAQQRDRHQIRGGKEVGDFRSVATAREGLEHRPV